MPDTPITTIPLSQFPPCCGTCRHWGRMYSACAEPSQLGTRVPVNGYCQKHKPREDER